MLKKIEATRFGFRQLLELDACTRCGECVKWCPTFAEKQELDEITPLRKIERVRSSMRAQALGPLSRLFGYQRPTEEMLQLSSTGTYDCTLCGRCAIVCLVGDGIRTTPGIAAQVFSAIGEINVLMISQGASEINLSIVVREDAAAEVVRRLHDEFFSEVGRSGVFEPIGKEGPS